METMALVVHLLLALALIGVVLLQRSEGGALGIGGGSAGGLFSARGAASALTRTTAILGALFMASSLFLAILAGQNDSGGSIFDAPEVVEQVPASDQVPAAPLAE